MALRFETIKTVHKAAKTLKTNCIKPVITIVAIPAILFNTAHASTPGVLTECVEINEAKIPDAVKYCTFKVMVGTVCYVSTLNYSAHGSFGEIMSYLMKTNYVGPLPNKIPASTVRETINMEGKKSLLKSIVRSKCPKALVHFPEIISSFENL